MNLEQEIMKKSFKADKNGDTWRVLDVTTALDIAKEYAAAQVLFQSGEAVVRRITNLIPTTWLDPLLNGENAVIGDPPYDCKDIEKLLLVIKEKIIKSA